MATLQEQVINKLVLENDFSLDDAEELVNESAENSPQLWHEDADVDQLVKLVADGDDAE